MTFCDIIQAELSNLHSTFSIETSEGETFFSIENVFLLWLSDIERKLFDLLSKIFWRCCQICILRVHGNLLILNFFLWKKIQFLSTSNTGQKGFRCFVALFRRGCQNYILGFRRKNLGQKQFFRKISILSITLGCWAKNLRLFVKLFSAKMTKLQLTCPRELFEVNRFSLKHIFLSSLNIEQNSVRPFVEKLSAGLSKI